MKFEKFFKAVGTHGTIVKLDNGESWLVCDGVGMLIPKGVNNFGVVSDGAGKDLIDSITACEFFSEDILVLTKAIIEDPRGGNKDIIREFETLNFDDIRIRNADYGLLEKHDRLYYLETEANDENGENPEDFKFMVVSDLNDNVIGFITGIAEE